MVFMGRVGEFLLIMYLECVKYLMIFKYKVFVKLLLVTWYHVPALRNVNNRLEATLFYGANFFHLMTKKSPMQFLQRIFVENLYHAKFLDFEDFIF